MKYKINYKSSTSSSSNNIESEINNLNNIESQIDDLNYKSIVGINKELSTNDKINYVFIIKEKFRKDNDINKLIEYLNSNNIKITSIELKYIFNNNTLRDAVNEWCDNKDVARIQYGDINTWDVSQVTDMIELFRRKEQFNDNISNWDTSNVTNMSKMFYDTDNFNQDIYTRVLPDGKIAWDVSNVTNMSQMFSNAKSFNGNISNWNTSNVTDMYAMFTRNNFDGFIKNLYGIYARTNNFDGKNSEKDLSIPISSSSISSSSNSIKYNDLIFPKDMKGATRNFHFNRIKKINSEKKIDEYLIDNGISIKEDYNKTSSSRNPNNSEDKLSDMYGIIKAIDGDLNFQNINTKIVVNTEDQYLYTAWDVSNVTNMSQMFSNAKSFNGNISNWDTSNVTNMMHMFSDNISFNGNISNWNTSNVINMSYMFQKAILFNNGKEPLITREITKEDGTAYTAWDVSNVIVMRMMFYEAKSFNQPILNWDTSNVSNMQSMFNGSQIFSDNRIALWLINIDILSYTDMFKNSGITKNSFVDRNNNKIIPYNRLIAKYFNLPEEYMRINVKDIVKKTNYNIDVNPIDKIIDVKKKLKYSEIDISPYLQRLVLDGKNLDDDRTLISYKIENDSTLFLTYSYHIVIYVKDLSGKTYTFNVNPEDTIQSVKESIRIENGIPIERQRLIFFKNGIPIERQRLIFNSTDWQELRNNRSLYSYNIINKSTLYLVLRIQQQEQNL